VGENPEKELPRIQKKEDRGSKSHNTHPAQPSLLAKLAPSQKQETNMADRVTPTRTQSKTDPPSLAIKLGRTWKMNSQRLKTTMIAVNDSIQLISLTP
jgi:hypothetical protein